MKTILLILAALAVLFVITVLAAFLIVRVYLFVHRDDNNDWE